MSRLSFPTAREWKWREAWKTPQGNHFIVIKQQEKVSPSWSIINVRECQVQWFCYNLLIVSPGIHLIKNCESHSRINASQSRINTSQSRINASQFKKQWVPTTTTNNNSIFNQGKPVSWSCHKWVPWTNKKWTIKGKDNYNRSTIRKVEELCTM